MFVNSASEKNKRVPMLHCRVENGWAVCPICGAKLCRIYYGASVRGVELYCRSQKCHAPRMLEVG